MALDVIAHRGRRNVFQATLYDADGDAIVVDSGDIVRLKIGRPGETPVLDLADTAASANGSSISHGNPTEVVLAPADASLFNPGIWDMDWILDDAQSSGQLLTADVGRLILHDAQTGNA